MFLDRALGRRFRFFPYYSYPRGWPKVDGMVLFFSEMGRSPLSQGFTLAPCSRRASWRLKWPSYDLVRQVSNLSLQESAWLRAKGVLSTLGV